MGELGRYTLVRPIGRGGMAEIWKAKATGPSGFVKFLALKMILPEIADDRVFVSMFVDEAKLEASMVHPNLIQVFDFGEIDGRLFLAMEYVAGANVDRLLNRLHKEGAAIPLDLAIYIAFEAARGLGYAHAKTDASGRPLGVVHRDISPHNIMVSTQGEVKVGDFGIARAASVVPRTAAGQVRGKLAYMSPEQLANTALDQRSDLFSLGAVLYEMVTGERLFSSTSGEDVFAQVLTFDPNACVDLALVPDAVREILVKLLQREPADRYPDGPALERDLGELLGLAGLNEARAKLGALVTHLFDDGIAADAQDETGPIERFDASAPTVLNRRPESPTPVRSRPRADRVPAVSSLTPTPTPAPAPPTPTPVPAAAYRPPLVAATARPRRRRRLALAASIWVGVVAGGAGAWWHAARSHAAAGPARGGVIRLAIAREPENFDMFSTESSLTRVADSEVVEPFFRGDLDGEIEPWLIDRSQLGADARSVVLHLRPGVYFHDNPCLGGHERIATGEDVAYSIRKAVRYGTLVLPIRGLDTTHVPPSVADLAITVGGVDRDTVTIALTDPAPFYESQLADVHLLPHELDGCEDLRRMRQPVGTGPFRYASPPHGARMSLVRAPHYWQHADDGAPLPYLDGLEIQPVNEMSDVLARISHGELELAMPAREDWDRYIDVGDDGVQLKPRYKPLGIGIASHTSRTWVSLVCLLVTAADSPLRDVSVRAALAHALDRTALVSTSARPLAGPNNRFLDPRMLGYDATLPGISFDVDAARGFLAEAGHPDGTGLRPITIGTIHDPKLAAAIGAQAAAIGLHVTVVTVPPAGAGDAIEHGTVDAILVNAIWGLDEGENADVITETNRTVMSPALAKLQLELSGTRDRADRKPIYRRIEQTLLEELPTIPIAWGDLKSPLEVFFVNKAVRNFHDPVTGYAQLNDLAHTWLATSSSD